MTKWLLAEDARILTFDALVARSEVFERDWTDLVVKKTWSIFYKICPELTLKMCYLTYLIQRSLGDCPSSVATNSSGVANEGHLGVTKLKELLCSYGRWPGLHSDIKHCVKACLTCTMDKTTGPFEMGSHR